MDSRNVVIRPMTAADISAVAFLEKECFSDAWPAHMVAGLLTSGMDYCEVAEAPAMAGAAQDAETAGAAGTARGMAEPDAAGTARGMAEADAAGTAQGMAEPDAPEISAALLLGYVNIRVIGDEAELMRICTAPEVRGAGVGTALLLAGLRDMALHGATAATLEVRAGNAAAIRLYESHGFHPAGRRKYYYRDPEEDAVIYWNRNIRKTLEG